MPCWIHVGPIASGTHLVEDGDGPWRQLVGLGARKLLGLEMEAAALGGIAHRYALPFVVAKGVMDHADLHEHDRAKAFAARSSAEVLCVLLREVAGGLVEDSTRTKAELRGLELDIAALERALRADGGSVRVIGERLRRFRRQLGGGPALSSGDVLGGRYRLLGRAGEGGFATVWRAADREIEDIVAVKILHAQWTAGARQARFESSARRMLTLTHEAIVKLLAPPQRDGPHVFLVLRWYAGGDLRRALSEGALDRRAGLRALARALDGLASAHAQGIVHRDVEPGNILIDDAGRGYIGDFDLAWADDSTHGTRTGPLGTFVYAAPEQLHDASTVGIQADVYGAGMCALFVLAGHNPPVFVERMEPDFIERLPCSPRLRRELTRAVACAVEERMQAVGELAAALRDELALDQGQAQVEESER